MKWVLRVERETLLDVLVLAVVVLIPLILNTWRPYHADTAGFALAAREHAFDDGWRWGTRLVYVFLGYLFGDLAHPVFLLLSITLLLWGGYLFFRRYTRRPFLALALLLSIPAAVMTVGIGKEDIFPMGLALFSLGIFGASLPLSVLSGFLFMFSVGAKETAVLLAPLFLPLLWGRVKNKDWKTVGAFVAGALLLAVPALSWILNLLAQRNPGLGVFYGFFSSLLPLGSSLLFEGIGLLVLPALLVLFIPALPRERRPFVFLLFAYAALMFLYLSNVSVVSYRHALWIMPVLALLYVLLAEHLSWGKWVSYALLVLSLVSVFSLIPNLQVKQIDLPARFASELSAYTEENALILAMDACPIIRYFSGRECRGHPAYAYTDENVWAEVSALRAESRPLYVYPDYFAYDRHGEFRKAFLSAFRLEPVYTDWYEDYHAVRIYSGEKAFLDFLLKHGFPAGCTLSYIPAGNDTIYGLPVELRQYTLNCGHLAYDLGVIPVYNGLLLFGVTRTTVYRAYPT